MCAILFYAVYQYFFIRVALFRLLYYHILLIQQTPNTKYTPQNMNSMDRIQLEKMIQANDAADNTEHIRELRHSMRIHEDVATLLKLKHDYARLAKTNPEQFDMMCVNRCAFLFNTYTDIFNKVKKDEIDLTILGQLLGVLKMIEDGKVGQHEASVEVGKLLKQIYIDSALKKSDKLDKQHSGSGSESLPAPKKISWKQYKAAPPST